MWNLFSNCSQLSQVVSIPSSSTSVTAQSVLLLHSCLALFAQTAQLYLRATKLHRTCLQAPVSVGNRYNGTLDMSYDSNHASRGWDSSSLVSAPVSGAMPLEHATLVQQPLPDDDNRAIEN